MSSRNVFSVLDLEQDKNPLVKKVLKGTKQFNIQKITPQSSSATSTSWVWQPPSQNTVVDRRIDIEYEIVINTSGSDFNTGNGPTGNFRYPTLKYNNANANASYVARAAGCNRLVAAEILDSTCSNNFALRQFPLANAMNSIELDINGTHFSSSVSDYIQAIMRYTTVPYRERQFNETAHMPDRNAYGATKGTDSHALMWDNVGISGESPRGKIEFTGGGSKKLTTIVREPLFLSPLLQHHGQGMTNINSLAVTINWKANPLPYMVSLLPDGITAYTSGVEAVSVSIAASKLSIDLSDGTKNIVCRYYTPQDDVDIPSQISIPYVQPIVRKSTFPATTSTAGTDIFLAQSSSVTGDAIRLSQIPTCVYLYVRVADASKNVNDATLFADCFGQITNVNVQWGNQSRLSELSGNDLRELAVRNGADDVYTNHSGDGFVIKLYFGKDVGLENNETPGMRGDYNWQCTVTSAYPDISRDTVASTQFEFVQVFMYEGEVKISPNQCLAETGTISISDVIEAKDDHSVREENQDGGSLVGGSLLGKIDKGRRLGLKSYQVAKDINEVVKEYKTRSD